VSLVFGWVAPAYGYDSALPIQPDTVATGFRVFMTIPPLVGAILALVSLALYPLYGERLAQVKAELATWTVDS
jgi:GPH family glycoside/pentoside/hexuronide:cation symporter